MEPLLTVSGKAAPLPGANIDTDVIMPKQFLKGLDRTGLDRGVFFDLRTMPDGSENPDFIFNRPAWRGSRILVVGPNFGCGSSREHAVWGLRQIGIRVLIGTSYAGIFFDNCARNGLLALSLDGDTVDRLMTAASDAEHNRMTVDVPRQVIVLDDESRFSFKLSPVLKSMLMSGLDPVGLTLQDRDAISDFEAAYPTARPWLARSEAWSETAAK